MQWLWPSHLIFYCFAKFSSSFSKSFEGRIQFLSVAHDDPGCSPHPPVLHLILIHDLPDHPAARPPTTQTAAAATASYFCVYSKDSL